MLRLLFVGLLFCKLNAQNKRNLVWEANAFKAISIELPLANTIVVSTTNSPQIKVEYLSEGEYQDHLVLRVNEEEQGLQLVEQQAPSFKNHHDKLSAHKVWASSLKILLPEGLPLQLKADNAQLNLRGNFTQLFVFLREGSLDITGQKINGKLETQKADVTLYGQKTLTHISSKYGTVSGLNSPLDQSELIIQSVEGNISLLSHRK